MKRATCAACGHRLTKRGQTRFCSKSCASQQPRSRKARSKTCAACGKTFTRKFPCQIQRATTCTKRCEGEIKRRQFVANRLGMVQAQYGVLSVKERELFAWGYRLGYARHANTQARQAQRAKAAA